MTIGAKDASTVWPGGARRAPISIAGVKIFELGNVLTRSGHMTEIFRSDWPVVDIQIAQVNWVQMAPGAVTDWHVHADQTDQLTAVGGVVKLALWDGRPESETHGASEVIRMGALRPILVVVPPGVWHGLRNESGEPAGYLNMTNQLYIHADPDNRRLRPGEGAIPDIL